MAWKNKMYGHDTQFLPWFHKIFPPRAEIVHGSGTSTVADDSRQRDHQEYLTKFAVCSGLAFVHPVFDHEAGS
jgi:hypothetical protein